MEENTSHDCIVEGCMAPAVERARGIYWCDRHWDALCAAYARQRLGAPLATAGAGLRADGGHERN